MGGALQSVVDNIIQSDPDDNGLKEKTSSATPSSSSDQGWSTVESLFNKNSNNGNNFNTSTSKNNNNDTKTIASIFDNNNSSSIWKDKSATDAITENAQNGHTVMKNLWSIDAGTNMN